MENKDLKTEVIVLDYRDEISDKVRRYFQLKNIERAQELLVLEEKLNLELEKLRVNYLKEEKSLWGPDFQKYEDLKQSIYEENMRMRDQFNDTPEGRKIRKEFQKKSRDKIIKLMDSVDIDIEQYNEIQYEHMNESQSTFENLCGSVELPGFGNKISKQSILLQFENLPWIMFIPPYIHSDHFWMIKNQTDLTINEYSDIEADPITGNMRCDMNLIMDPGIYVYEDPITDKWTYTLDYSAYYTSMLGIDYNIRKKGKLEITFYLENKNGPTQCDIDISPSDIKHFPPFVFVKSDMRLSIHGKNQSEDKSIPMVDKYIKTSDFKPNYNYSQPFNVSKGSVWPLRFTSDNIYEVGDYLEIRLYIDNHINKHAVSGEIKIFNEWCLKSIGLKII